jgi:hypothetical protein
MGLSFRADALRLDAAAASSSTAFPADALSGMKSIALRQRQQARPVGRGRRSKCAQKAAAQWLWSAKPVANAASASIAPSRIIDRAVVSRCAYNAVWCRRRLSPQLCGAFRGPFPKSRKKLRT